MLSCLFTARQVPISTQILRRAVVAQHPLYDHHKIRYLNTEVALRLPPHQAGWLMMMWSNAMKGQTQLARRWHGQPPPPIPCRIRLAQKAIRLIVMPSQQTWRACTCLRPRAQPMCRPPLEQAAPCKHLWWRSRLPSPLAANPSALKRASQSTDGQLRIYSLCLFNHCDTVLLVRCMSRAGLVTASTTCQELAWPHMQVQHACL